MKKDALRKLYDRFSGEERFKLFIEAAARGDEEEVKRLSESCPCESYRMRELAYIDRCKASMMMTTGVCLDLALHLVKLRATETFLEIFPSIFNLCEDVAILAYLLGREAASKCDGEAAVKTGDPAMKWGDEEEGDSATEGDPPRITGRLKEMREAFVGPLEELERHIAGDALTVWGGFANFCDEELLVEPEKLVKVWFEPMLPEIEKLKNLPDPPEADQEGLKEYEAALKQGWSKLVREV